MAIDKVNYLKDGGDESPGFICDNCHRDVSGPENQALGTRHRNHCPYCLYSKHLDKEVSGDRRAFCGGLMAPIGLTFKEEGFDKYGKKRVGEIMIVHRCLSCGKISINRLASDDSEDEIINVFDHSLLLSDDDREAIFKGGINLSKEEDRKEIRRQLLGESI